MRNFVVLLFIVFLSFGLSQELIINGDFEQELTVGWNQIFNGSGTQIIDRSLTYQPDLDWEAMAYQYDNPGWARLSQTVYAPSPMLELSFEASFAESGGVSTCWPAACFSVCYLNTDDAVLGETRYVYSTYDTWTTTPTRHLIDITNPGWVEYSLNIEDELTQNLPGVNQGEIVKVEVALFAYTDGG